MSCALQKENVSCSEHKKGLSCLEHEEAVGYPVQKETVNCAVKNEAVGYSELKGAMSSLKHSVTVTCTEHKEVVNCSELKETVNCSELKETVSCSEYKGSVSCSEHEGAVGCSKRDGAVSCSEHEGAVSYSEHEEAVSCLKHEEAVSCLKHEETVSCLKHEEAMSCSEHEETVSCLKHEEAVSCSEHEETVSCLKHEEAVSCLKHEEAVSCSEHEETVSCLKHEEAVSCLKYEGAMGCSEHDRAMNCPKQKETVSYAIQKEEVNLKEPTEIVASKAEKIEGLVERVGCCRRSECGPKSELIQKLVRSQVECEVTRSGSDEVSSQSTREEMSQKSGSCFLGSRFDKMCPASSDNDHEYGLLGWSDELKAEERKNCKITDFQVQFGECSWKKFDETDTGEESHKMEENREVVRTQKKEETARQQFRPRKNNRKSASPVQIKETVVHRYSSKGRPVPDLEETITQISEESADEENVKEVVSGDGDLLKFAEILYKCCLCTTLPCILTSRLAFLCHVREHHLITPVTPGIQCTVCSLYFHTDADLQAHLFDYHPGSAQETLKMDRADTSEARLDRDGQIVQLDQNHSEELSSEDESLQIKHFSQFEVGDEETCGRSFEQSSEDSSDRKQRDVEDNFEGALNPGSHVERGPSEPPSLPLATLEYHSTSQTLNKQQVAAEGIISQPLLLHSPPAEDTRTLLPNCSPEVMSSCATSFTPEFGRYTKLIREGGKIVYFCQVCNVKCQVKAAFQVHCDGIRHHNQVNMTGKSKSHLSSAETYFLRDSRCRTPLKEVSVAGSLVTLPFADISLVKKMTKFFDYPDVSIMLNRSKHVNTLPFVRTATDVSGGVECLAGYPNFKGPSASRRDVSSPAFDQGYIYDKTYHSENVLSVPFSRDFSDPQNKSGNCTQDLKIKERCNSAIFRKSDRNKFDVWSNPEENILDLTRRKRTASANAEGGSPVSLDSESANLRTRSPVTPGNFPVSACMEAEENQQTDGDVFNTSDDPESPACKRVKLDVWQKNDLQNCVPNEHYQASASPHKRSDEDISRDDACLKNIQDKYDQTKVCNLRQTAKQLQGEQLNRKLKPTDVKHLTDLHSDFSIEGSDVRVACAPATSRTNPSESSDPGVASHGKAKQATVDMLNSCGNSASLDSLLYPGILDDEYFNEESAENDDLEASTWSGESSCSQDNEDTATDPGKSPNNEGWKVAKIRHVLRGQLAASNKGCSLSRDVLLHRVSVALQEPDVLYWGPACNRAVRELYPQCLAQRKGKFKKTYFFGLSFRPGLEEARADDPVDGLSFRPLRDMTQDLEQLLEHLPGLLSWRGHLDRGVSRDDVLHVLAARLSEGEVYQWGMQCNKALRILFPLVHMKRKGKYKTVYFGVDFTTTAKSLVPTIRAASEQLHGQE